MYMAEKIREHPENLRRRISPRVRQATRDDLVTVLRAAEKETASKAIEFVDKIAAKDDWRLDDWVQLGKLADMGRYFYEIAIAFTEIPQIDEVASSSDDN